LLAGSTVTIALAAIPASRLKPSAAAVDTLSIRVSEGTALSFDLTPDGRFLIIDLLGQLWEIPIGGGSARAITNAVAEMADDRQPAVSPDGNWIATRSDRPTGRGIWLHPVSGKLHRQVTDSGLILGDDAGLPAWAPDGRRLAFIRQGGLWLVSRIGDPPARVSVSGLSGVIDEPDWHPDGSRLAVSGPWRGGPARALLDGPPGASIWEVDLAGGAARRLTQDARFARAPAWSPDGRSVAYFAADTAGHFRLEVLPNGGIARVVARDSAMEPRRVRWSRDGRTLIYVAAGRLRRVPADGGVSGEIRFSAELHLPRDRYVRRPVQVPQPGDTVEAHGFSGVALSPDGSRIGLLALGRLWLADTGGEARPVASVPPYASTLTWHPDGREVAWVARGDSAEDVFATDLATGVSRPLTNLPGEEARPAWSPDGRWIAFYHWPKSGSRSPPWSDDDSETWLRIADARLDRPITTADTRVLSEVAWGEISAYASPTRWMPDGRTLLAFGGEGWPVAGRDCVQALLFRPDSSRLPVERFPCRPGHLVLGEDSSLIVVERGELVRYRRTARGWEDGRPLGTGAALSPALARDGTLLYVAPDGLRLRRPDGRERHLGWPVRFTVPEPEPLLIRNARLVSLEAGADTGLRDLLLERGRFRRIAAAGSLPRGVREVDAGGRWAIPGLIDGHGHVGDAHAPLRAALYHGVTILREMWHPLGDGAAARDAVNAGIAAGARVIVSGPPVYPTPSGAPLTSDFLWIPVDSVTAERGVALLRGFGAGHLKMRYVQSWSGAAPLLRIAHRHGLSVSGHCAHALTVVAAGIDGQEHLDGQCGDWEFGVHDDVVQLYRAAGIAVTPVIDYHDETARTARDSSRIHAPDVEPFLTPALRLDAIRQNTPALLQRVEGRARRAREATRRMYAAGVRIVAGTDAHMYPGGIARELEALVAAGLTPRDALRAATVDAAAVTGLEGQAGRIAVGHLADLVLLDADPLADVGNVRRIHLVIQGGRVIDRQRLLSAQR
jgi:imidazolonepropionase-like amidohydrolase/Tol biopolymer transport system component